MPSRRFEHGSQTSTVDEATSVVEPEAFAQLPPGCTAALVVVGECMSPIIRDGDQVEALRCAAADAVRGDIVIVRHSAGFRVHLLIGADPPKTGTLVGRRDHGDIEVLGRVIRVRRGRRFFTLHTWARVPLRFGHHFAHAVLEAKLHAVVRRFARAIRNGASLGAIVGHDRGYLEVRALTLADSSELVRFCARSRLGRGQECLRSLRTRWISSAGFAVGAFDRRGRLYGVAAAELIAESSPAVREVLFHVSAGPRSANVAARLRSSVLETARARGLEFVVGAATSRRMGGV